MKLVQRRTNVATRPHRVNEFWKLYDMDQIARQKISIFVFAIASMISASKTGEESYSRPRITTVKENIVRTMDLQRHKSKKMIAQPTADYTRETSTSGETSGSNARTVNGIVLRTIAERPNRTFDVLDGSAIRDGVDHPLSNNYNMLKGAQVDYPAAGSLIDQIDGYAIQRTVERARLAGGGTVLVPYL
ncbi:hypothetical protein [Methylorubrum extorquens]|uniref:Uncharacterized protein n=1 Tax=Methylorubrum extorquens DSM 13060 TaxID=882800 RepID=H1KTP0_METEX|nr:hypothetical protein [Methylorubrum extorquens]EHP84005.1 hypothetical protein MetexDRAFT_6003 [Methylorubrum extorquens DSM 13060]